MSRSRRATTGDYWPPRERPDSYQPPTSHRLSTGVMKSSKGNGRRRTKSKTSESGRLSPETEVEVDASTPKTMREEIDYLVQTTSKLENTLKSVEAKVDNVNSKLDQVLAFLGVKITTKASTKTADLSKQQRLLRVIEQDASEESFADPAELAVALRARQEESSTQSESLRKFLALDATATDVAVQAAHETDLEGMRRNLKVVRKYLDGI